MNPIYVDDVVAAVQAGLDSSESRVLNVAGPDVLTIREIAEAVAAVLGREPVFEQGTATVAGDIVCDVVRLRELVQRPLVSFSNGIQLTVDGG
jgi:nucleoside-diphosphate-sugar epimerase